VLSCTAPAKIPTDPLVTGHDLSPAASFAQAVGTLPINLAITPDQVRTVLGEPHLQAVARKLGLSTTDVANQLAGLLPHAVDAATPGGAPAQGSLLTEALNAFSALRR